jgi:hypothetical protein
MLKRETIFFYFFSLKILKNYLFPDQIFFIMVSPCLIIQSNFPSYKCQRFQADCICIVMDAPDQTQDQVD